MKLKIAQPQKTLKAELKQYFADNMYFFYIKNITKNLMISAKIVFPELFTYQTSPDPNFPLQNNSDILRTVIVTAIDPDSGELVEEERPPRP